MSKKLFRPHLEIEFCYSAHRFLCKIKMIDLFSPFPMVVSIQCETVRRSKFSTNIRTNEYENRFPSRGVAFPSMLAMVNDIRNAVINARFYMKARLCRYSYYLRAVFQKRRRVSTRMTGYQDSLVEGPVSCRASVLHGGHNDEFRRFPKQSYIYKCLYGSRPGGVKSSNIVTGPQC